MSLVPPSHREGKVRNVADSYEKISQRIKVRQDSADNWNKNDPVLEAGEFGYELGYPNGKLKIGTGSTRWTELPYLMARGPAGAPGPAGPPGKGIQIKGVADVWPPAGTPEPGDLWIMGDPLPPGSPAGADIGDGYVWTGTKWTPTGPIRGPAGESVEVFTGAATPTANRVGDLWIEPDPATAPNAVTLNIWDGANWAPVSGSSSSLPTPTSDGYLRADSQVWGFAEPVVVASSAPADPGVASAIWIDPTVRISTFSITNPLDYADPPITEDADGYPIGLDPTGQFVHQPLMVGAIPVIVNGKTYLLPLLDAPAFATKVTPVFDFTDPVQTQQADGSYIGLGSDGNYHQPFMVGAIPVNVNGKQYLLPLLEE